MRCGARLLPQGSTPPILAFRCARFPACGGAEATGASGVLEWPEPHTAPWCSAHRAAHAAFDPLWQNTLVGIGGVPTLGHARVRCYEWLSAVLGIPLGTCHLALHTIHALETVVDACKGMTPAAITSWWKLQPGVKVQTGALVATDLSALPVAYWIKTPPRVRIAFEAYGVKSAKVAVQVACGELKLPHPMREDLLDMLQGDLLLAGAVRGPTPAEMKAKPQDVPTLDFHASRRALVRYESLVKITKNVSALLGESK